MKTLLRAGTLLATACASLGSHAAILEDQWDLSYIKESDTSWALTFIVPNGSDKLVRSTYSLSRNPVPGSDTMHWVLESRFLPEETDSGWRLATSFGFLRPGDTLDPQRYFPWDGPSSMYSAANEFWVGGGVDAHPMDWYDCFKGSCTVTTIQPGEWPVHGWAHFRIEGDGSITLLDNVLGLRTDSVSVVPEPGTWALMAIGLAGVGMTARRRTKAANA